MGQKNNPLLASFEAKLEAIYRGRLTINDEVDRIAFLMTINDDLKVGPGRAGTLLNDFMATKLEIAEAMIEDSGFKKGEGDKEMLHTRYVIAKRICKILSPEDLERFRPSFPFIGEFIDEVLNERT